MIVEKSTESPIHLAIVTWELKVLRPSFWKNLVPSAYLIVKSNYTCTNMLCMYNIYKFFIYFSFPPEKFHDETICF